MAAAKTPDSVGSSVRSCLCSVLHGRSPWNSAKEGARVAFVVILLCHLLRTGASRPSPSRHRTHTTAAAAAAAAADAITHAVGSQQHLSTSPLPATGQDVVTAAAQISTPASTAPRGRGLKQIPYDPYGYGYYDPYVAGVTPGFVNVDVNRETGLHMDVGHVAVDVSADKNYVGLGVGTLFGVGAARDRGWNLQLGDGKVLDASVTKDAGLGLWVLDGLVNVNIGPEGIFKNAKPGNVAARTTDAATPVQIQSVTVDDTPVQTAALQQQQQQQQQVVYPADHAGSKPSIPEVTVDDPAAMVAHHQQQQQNYSGTTEVNPPMYTTDAPEVNQMYTQDPANYSSSPPAAAAPAESQLPSYDFMDLLAYDPAADTVVAGNATSRSRLAAPTPAAQSAHMAQAYQQNVPQAYSGLGASTAAGSAASAATATPAGATYQSHLIARPAAPPPPSPAADHLVAAPPPASSTYPSYTVSRPAATGTEQDDTWTVASQYSDTQQMAAARLAAMTAPTRPSSQSSMLQRAQGVSPASSAYGTKAPQQQWQYQQPNGFRPQQPQQQPPTISRATYEGESEGSGDVLDMSSSPRRACAGGVQVLVTGSRFKCKYKKAEPELSAVPTGPLKVASGQYTYTNGVAV